MKSFDSNPGDFSIVVIRWPQGYRSFGVKQLFSQDKQYFQYCTDVEIFPAQFTTANLTVIATTVLYNCNTINNRGVVRLEVVLDSPEGDPSMP